MKPLEQGLARRKHSKCWSKWFSLKVMCSVRAVFCYCARSSVLSTCCSHPHFSPGGAGTRGRNWEGGVSPTGPSSWHPVVPPGSRRLASEEGCSWAPGYPGYWVGGYRRHEGKDWVCLVPCGFPVLVRGLAFGEGFILVFAQ